MSGYCRERAFRQKNVYDREADVRRSARLAARKAEPSMKDLARIAEDKAQLASQREILAQHDAECEVCS